MGLQIKHTLSSLRESRLRRLATSRRALTLEALEDRTVPSTFEITGGAITYTAGAGIANNLDVSVNTGTGVYTFQDTSEAIAIGPTASGLGYTNPGGNPNVVQGPAAPVSAINLLMGDGNDTVNLLSEIDATTISNGSGADSYTIGNGLQGVQGVVGDVSVNGANSTSLVVNDSADATGRSAVLTGTTITGLSSAIISYASLSSLTVNGGTGGNLFQVNGTFAGGTTSLNSGAGNDTVNVTATTGPLGINGQAGSDLVSIDINGITNSVQVSNPGGSTALTINSSAASENYTITGTTVTDGVDVVTYANLSSLTVVGTGGNDSAAVQATSVPTSVNTGAGSDSITVTSATNTLDAIAAALTIDAGAGANSIGLDDSGAAVGNTATITSSSVTGLAPAVINYGATGGSTSLDVQGSNAQPDSLTLLSTLNSPSSVVLNGNGGDDLFAIRGISGLTTVNTGAGNDTVTVASATNTLDTITANLVLSNSTGSDTFIVDDSGQTNPAQDNTNVIITNNMIAGLSGVSNETIITYVPGTALTLTVLGSNSRPDSIAVRSTNASTTTNVVTGGGDDSISVFDGPLPANENLDAILGALNLDLGAGANTLVVSDKTAASANTNAIISSNSITGLAPAAIGYLTSGTLALTVRGSDSVTDTITIQSTLGGSSSLLVESGGGGDVINVQAISGVTTVNTGAGDDTVTVTSASSTLDGILAPLTIDTAGGNNALTVRNFGPTNANRRLVVSATTIVGYDFTDPAQTTPQAQIAYAATGGTLVLAVEGSDSGSDTVLVTGSLDAGSNTIIRTFGGDDSIQINVDPLTLSGPVEALGGSGSDTLTVSGTVDADFFTITGTTVSNPAAGLITYNSSALDIEALNLTTLQGDDIVFIDGTSAPTTVDTAEGNDLITINASASVAAIQSIVAGDGQDTLVYNGTSNPNTIFLIGNGIRGAGAAPTGYVSVEQLTVNAGDGNDTISINEPTASNTTVNGGSGNDAISICSQGATGNPVTLQGGDGSDEYIFANGGTLHAGQIVDSSFDNSPYTIVGGTLVIPTGNILNFQAYQTSVRVNLSGSVLTPNTGGAQGGVPLTPLPPVFSATGVLNGQANGLVGNFQTVVGGSAGDVLVGGDNPSLQYRLEGRAGDDTLYAIGGITVPPPPPDNSSLPNPPARPANVLLGGDGYDVLVGGAPAATQAYGPTGTAVLYGGPSLPLSSANPPQVELLIGGAANDILITDTCADQSNGTTSITPANGNLILAREQFMSFPAGSATNRFDSTLNPIGLGTLECPMTLPGATLSAASVSTTARKSNLVLGILQSQEYRAGTVDSLFQGFLGRSADQGGLDVFVAALAAGASEEDVAAGIVASDEYRTLNGGTDEGLAAALYRDILGRSGSSEEVAFWAGRIAVTPREAIAHAFLTSDEFYVMIVRSVYSDVLGRDADEAGLAHWVRQAQQGVRYADLQAAFLSSDEFVARIAGSAADVEREYVQAIYTNLIGRTAGESEIGFWLGVLGA